MDLILGSSVSYTAPSWLLNGCVSSRCIPTNRIVLGRFPTPLQRIQFQSDDINLEWWVKRDDLSSFDLSGNKVRKLEFLLWEAKQRECDSVITVGGEQSNHCRATAVAARQIGLEPHLILRRPTGSPETLGLAGNLLLDRMVGSKLYTVSTGTYIQHGSQRLCNILATRLEEAGKKPYVIPVGGSNSLGAFGYISCIQELIQQMEQLALDFDHIVVACGSGGTLAGLAIGARLSGIKAKLHIVGVCDTPEEFFDHLREVASSFEIDFTKYGPVETWCNIYAGQGIGYAKSTEAELRFLIELSQSTGIILDPVYSGKAFYHFVHTVLLEQREVFTPGQKVLFIHTGGVFGLYDKAAQLMELLPETSPEVQKLIVKPI
jgi:D-cysteine desulfhydrase